MKKLFALSAVLLSANAYAGPFAPAVGQPGSTALAKNDPAFSEWATGWLNYQPGADLDATWETPEKALGPATGNSSDIVSLGNGGQITLTFDHPIQNGAGYDFAVFENSFSDTFLELAFVEVSSNGSNFFRFPNYSYTPAAVSAFGSVNPTNLYGYAGKYRGGYGTPFDLSELTGIAGLDLDNINYVRLVDVLGNGTEKDSLGNKVYDPYKTTSSAGFDLEALGVLHSNLGVAAVPLPASAWLLLSALPFFTGLRRKSSV
ncbi:VPLPA-CTERM sorting domain-containing protein [Methylomonas sp. DH-1]|uniref:VPLPA-CTERM sorting domain-containing protein n=1 Tax=Methylomonas sp. (strain DH-1) TaxID=1727196 RepID=UPI0007C8B917|nr:VPLPA-CTERM sorting domain-containing protein [Methylomonas sp. DH-1]ANE53921.1 PEP-CTERM sorting domain-containing protein [Methylomonas sp. DH-1]